MPHGNFKEGIATCQLHMRKFQDGETIYVEPFRAQAFPVVRDLIVDRSAFDRIIQAGGYVSVRTGSAPDANALPVPKFNADLAMDAAACIGCGGVRRGVSERQRDVVCRREDVSTLFAAARAGRARGTRLGDGAPDGPRRFRQLFQRLQLLGGVPEGNQRVVPSRG